MAEESSFSISKVAEYSDEEIQRRKDEFDARATRLNSLAAAYNDKVREATSASLPIEQRLANGNYWSNLRDVAQEMAGDALKKASACRIELDLRG